jgi:flagellar hook-length control protein FliK
MINSASASTSGNSGTPLTIAAAAIATAASTTSTVTAGSTPTTTDTTSSTKTADTTTTAKTQGQTQASTADTAAAPQAATAGTATSAALALAAAAGTPGATGEAKTTGLKATTTQGKTATTATNGTTPAADPSATANPAATTGTPQPTVDAKADATASLGAAIKPDGDAASTPSISSVTGHDRSAANAQAPTASVDPNAQAFALPQQLSTATSVGGTDKLTATQATGGAVPLSGIAVEIAAKVQNGKTRFEMRLDPAELGRIDVRIDVDRNGQVTSHLTVEKPETLSMLQQDAPQLQQALNDAGLKTGSSGLQFSLRDQSSSGQNSNFNQSGGQPQRLVISEDDNVPAAMAGRSYGRMLGASGGVDISV